MRFFALAAVCALALAANAHSVVIESSHDARDLFDARDESSGALVHRRHHRRSVPIEARSSSAKKCTPVKTNKKTSKKGNKTIVKKKKAKKSTTKKTTSKSSGKTTSSSTSANAAGLSGISAFKAKPNVGLGSWYQADTGRDSTNGHSWCGFPYKDSSPLFAPSVQTMLNNFGGNYEKAATAYCGLEAVVKNPHNGKTMTLVIGDGFASEWLRSPLSIDIMYDAFGTLNGAKTNDKNVVIQNIEWTLTGKRNEQYKFKGQGN